MKTRTLIRLTTLPLALLLAGHMAEAQDLLDRPVQPPQGGVPTPASDEEVTFSSDALEYDDQADVVTASGDVRMLRSGNRLRADRVIWNRKTGSVRAEGNVALVNTQGDTAYGDSIELKDTLKDGVVENLLLVLQNGGRLAAKHGNRVNGVTTLDHAAYTPCDVVDSDGCPKEPMWKITAVKVIHDPVKHRISYRDARLNILGVPILWLPGLSHPDGSGAGGASGLLVPDIKYSRRNGAELALPYYIQIAPNRDLTLTPHIYSEVLPAIEAQYRALTSNGAYQVSGMATYSSRVPASATGPDMTGNREFRGYIDVSGRFQLDPQWSITGSGRLATDRTFLRRYDITNDDRLREMIEAERIDQDSYLSIAGWGVQTLRVNDVQGRQPIAVPAIDFRQRFDDPWLGGRFELQLNTLSILRTEGQDTQRAFAGMRWDLRRYTTLGQELTLTAYSRADVYHTDDVTRTVTASYRGQPGWTYRGVAALALDMRWPFVGELFGGTQRLTPRVQLVASPRTKNLSVPNEDSRAIDLEDSNLFALNRFAGYDRWEDGNRITYGLEWAFDRPRLAIRTVIGQSYRLTKRASILPEGTGLSDRLSDVVGRTSIRFGRLVELTHRFRLDKDSLSVRRNEIDATVGSRKTYAMVGYLRLNRNVDPTIEDLRDREEIRLAARVQFAKYWSIFGSTVIDLTDSKEDPTSPADGYEPVRHRLGLLYEDDCIELGVTWRRDYDQTGDARRGNSYLLRLALKNLGR